MSNFEKQIIDIGSHKSGTTKLIQYKIVTDKIVKDFITTCSCVKPQYDKDKNIVYLYFKINNIPQHLKGIKILHQNKKFKVVFTDGEEEELELKYTIKNN